MTTEEQRAKEIADLQAEIAEHEHAAKVKALRETLESHKAKAPQWHKIEFLSHGKIAKEGKVTPEGQIVQPEYHPQDVVGHGYYVLENEEVVAIVDLQGKPLARGEPSHEHRCVGARLTERPYKQADG